MWQNSPYTCLTNTSKTSLTCQQNDDFIPVSPNGYTSMDPRLYDSPRSIRTVLDRPPLRTRNVDPLRSMYTDENNVQTGFYNSYSDIMGGDFVYYTDMDIAAPYFSPVYTNMSDVVPQIQIDPMGAYRPIYQRIPVLHNNRITSPYTFDQDQISFREDLMALQSRKINESIFDTYQLFSNPQTYFPQYYYHNQQQCDQ